MFPPLRLEQFEPPLSTGTELHSCDVELTKINIWATFQKDILRIFGINDTRINSEVGKAVARHLRPFVIENLPEETQYASTSLLDPHSTASVQILMSYMGLLFSNDLLIDEAAQYFVAMVNDLYPIGNLNSLFTERSPSAKAMATRILHAVVEIDATDFLKKALKSGVNVESPSTGDESMTLLQKALCSGNIEAARMLIKAGADVNTERSPSALNYFGDDADTLLCSCNGTGKNYPIAIAARSRNCVNIIPELIEKGATIPTQHPVLFLAIDAGARIHTVRCLIRAGADVNQYIEPCQGKCAAPLCTAARQGNSQLVGLLLDAGANPNGPTEFEDSTMLAIINGIFFTVEPPLLCALKSKNPNREDICQIAKLLLEFGADPNASALETIFKQQHLLDPEAVSSIYRANEPAGRRDSLLLYPLQAAAAFGDIELVKILLDHGVSVNSAYGTPALAVAARHSHVEIVRLLLSSDADPDWLGNQHYCESALEAAVVAENIPIMDLLLQSGADINKCSASHGGRTPLQRAAEIGSEEVIEYLLRNGASMLSQPAHIEGCSALKGFVQHQLHKYLSKALNLGANPNCESINGESPLVAGVLRNDTTSVRWLLAAGASAHEFSRAIFPDHEDAVLRVSCRKVATLEGLMLSPIQWAAAMGHVEVARILCEAGAEVNQSPNELPAGTALNLAVGYGHQNMVEFLISKKADVNSYQDGDTPLITAIYADNDLALGFLLRNGALPNLPANDHEFGHPDRPLLPLDEACDRKRVATIRILLQAGANPSLGYPLVHLFHDNHNTSNWTKDSPLELLLEHGADVNQRRPEHDTPLQGAILVEEYDCAYRLIEKGARINDPACQGRRGRTALQAAVSVGDVDMVEYLLQKGADVNAPAAAENGVTALQAAAIQGYLRIAQILLEHGAGIDAKAGLENGLTAIEGAAEFGMIDMVKLLLDNYHGPRPISEMRDEAYKAAEKGKQWNIIELLQNYEHPDASWP